MVYSQAQVQAVLLEQYPGSSMVMSPEGSEDTYWEVTVDGLTERFRTGIEIQERYGLGDALVAMYGDCVVSGGLKALLDACHMLEDLNWKELVNEVSDEAARDIWPEVQFGGIVNIDPDCVVDYVDPDKFKAAMKADGYSQEEIDDMPISDALSDVAELTELNLRNWQEDGYLGGCA